MKFSTADAVDFRSAFRTGPINDSAAALVEISDRVLNSPFCLAFYTIHCISL